METILVISAKTKDIAGFPVRRALPAIERRMIGPFVFLDQMGPTRLAPGQRLDVRPHPHIGLSTMTYLFEGQILHRDSLGTTQMIRPGAINWMTAGRGIAHSERTPEENDTNTLSEFSSGSRCRDRMKRWSRPLFTWKRANCRCSRIGRSPSA